MITVWLLTLCLPLAHGQALCAPQPEPPAYPSREACASAGRAQALPAGLSFECRPRPAPSTQPRDPRP